MLSRKEIEQVHLLIPTMIKIEEEKQKKSDRRFLVTCNVIAGANLAAGNIPGWLICTGLGFLPMLKNKLIK